jgi:hemolysin D
MLVFLTTVVWASVGRVDIVAVSPGRVVPVGQSKRIQAAEKGVVRAIRVVEGQSVRRGEVLVELDDRRALAEVERLTARIADLEQELARARAMIRWLTVGEEAAHSRDIDDPLLRRRWSEYRARQDLLATERERKRAELRSAEAEVARLQAQLPYVTRRAEDRARLSERSLVAEQDYLDAEQARLEVVHLLRAGEARAEQRRVEVRELEGRSRALEAEFHRQLAERLEEARQAREQAEQELRKAKVSAADHRVKSPVDGIVQDLRIHHPGAVVTPAQDLMTLVPANEHLIVEAVLENKDVGFVDAGQEVAIKVDTFPFTRYGTLPGAIANVSKDAVLHEQHGLVYTMRVSLGASAIEVNDKQIPLSPGMTVVVETRTGSRRLVEYFLAPLLRYADESVRER